MSKLPPPRRVKLPAAVRLKVHSRARELAFAAAETMIAALERTLSEEMAAAERRARPAVVSRETLLSGATWSTPPAE